jgi:hypothetical protein
VGQYSESLKRLEVAVGAVQGTLAKMSDNSAAIQSLIEAQKRLDEQIGKAIAGQGTLASGISSVTESQRQIEEQISTSATAQNQVISEIKNVAGRVTDSAAVTVAETKSATTSLAESLKQQITSSTSVTKEVVEKLASAIPAAAPWWQLPAQALGLTGPLGAAAVVITWLVAKRVGGRSWKTSGETGSGAAEVAPRPFQPDLTPRPGDTVTTAGHGPIRTVTVDSPAPPQISMPEVRFQSYETDRYARAHAQASAQVGRKFPNAVPYLESEREMIKQYLAS